MIKLKQSVTSDSLVMCRTVPDCRTPTTHQTSKLSPQVGGQLTSRRSRKARQRAVRMRSAYLGDETLRRPVPSPSDTATQRPDCIDDVDDVEACQLYEWTQNLSVED